MGLINLDIKPRSTFGKNSNRRTRAAGQIPGILYGKDRDPESFELENHSFSVALMHLAGRTALFSINGDADDIAVLKEIQRNPCTDEILHVDLMAIPRGVPVTLPVSLEVVGENEAVKTNEGSVFISLDRLEISVRPRDLPEYIEIDISNMELNDKVFAGDIKLEAGEVITDPETLLLNIKPVVVVEVEEEVEEGLEGEEGVEGEEGAEGDGEGKSEDDKKED